MHTYICICIHTHIYVYVCISVYMYMYMYIDTYLPPSPSPFPTPRWCGVRGVGCSYPPQPLNPQPITTHCGPRYCPTVGSFKGNVVNQPGTPVNPLAAGGLLVSEVPPRPPQVRILQSPHSSALSSASTHEPPPSAHLPNHLLNHARPPPPLLGDPRNQSPPPPDKHPLKCECHPIGPPRCGPEEGLFFFRACVS